MEVRFATEAAPGRPVNEDAALAVGSLVAVFDGVTQPDGLDTGCPHGPAWYVQRLAARLVEAYLARPVESLPHLLASAIESVRADHGGGCDLSHPGTPAASVAVLRDAGDRVEYLLLSDTVVVLDRDGALDVVADGRFEQTIAQVRRAALVPGAIGTDDHAARTRWSIEQKWRHTNQPGGYWIAAADPQAALEAVTGNAVVRRAALLTDGAWCAVEPFGLFDWPGALDVLTQRGPAELIRRVRAAEFADLDGAAQPRYKRHDDATAAICIFDWEVQ
ncbi:hypothetical protein [Phytohabitans rumicis]|uniref:PPM-type phosphatase domain-containing protein n=1 Tax=Phytohabitans rumicis TaxID=1076125 RepID=A0A6V8KRU8_9ACTN|nr:hypothetical protein [Phytohabitans rumicis]GFJ87863.1 hypothetical protein Prum_015050 [Phytohabitans rumicis]